MSCCLHSLLHYQHQSSVTSSPPMFFNLFLLYSHPLLILSLSPTLLVPCPLLSLTTLSLLSLCPSPTVPIIPFSYCPYYPLPLLSLLSPSPTVPIPFPYCPYPLSPIPYSPYPTTLVSNPTLPSQKIKKYLLITLFQILTWKIACGKV